MHYCPKRAFETNKPIPSLNESPPSEEVLSAAAVVAEDLGLFEVELDSVIQSHPELVIKQIKVARIVAAYGPTDYEDDRLIEWHDECRSDLKAAVEWAFGKDIDISDHEPWEILAFYLNR